MISSFRAPNRKRKPPVIVKPIPQKLLVVLPFYSGDEWLLLKNLELMKEMDGHLNFDCLLTTDTITNPARALAAAAGLFDLVTAFQYPRPLRSDWPFPQNNMFMHTAWRIYNAHRGPWLLCETDATPLNKGWLSDLWLEYRKGNKPFGGVWSEKAKAFNGTAIYPSNVVQYSQKMMTAALTRDVNDGQPPWDMFGSKEVFPHLHVMNGLMQHVWDDGAGKAHTFPTMKAFKTIVRPGVVLFHRCKDGSLVDRARERFRGRKYGKDLLEAGWQPQLPA